MKKTLLTLSLGLLCVILHAQDSTSLFIDSIAQHSLELNAQAGFAIAVIQDGEVIHSKGYGVLSVESKEAVNSHSRFCIASNSKAFTTTAIAMLVNEGKLKWSDKVVDHIPEFKMHDEYLTAHFTLEDMCTHRSGYGLGAGDLLFIPDGGDYTIDDVIAAIQYQTPVSEFRTKYDYNNLMYMIAGEVIKRASGLSWSDFVEQRIMAPLQMNESVALVENLTSRDNVAEPHRTDAASLQVLPPHQNGKGGYQGPAAGIYSSVNDLSKWVIMHMNEGRYGDSSVLLSSEAHNALWTAQTNSFFNATPPEPYRTHFRSYGLGFNLYDQNGYLIVQHSGGMPGMLSMVTMIPEKRAAVIVLTNSAPGGYAFLSLTNTIKDRLIGVEGRNWIDLYSNYLGRTQHNADSIVADAWQQVSDSSKVAPKIKRFKGTYEDPWFGKVKIYEKEGKWVFQSLRSPKLTGIMHYYGNNTFAIRWNYQNMDCDAFAKFKLGEDGKAESIKISGISPLLDFSFDFQDLNLKRCN